MNRRRTAHEIWQDLRAGLAGLPATAPLALRSIRKRPLRALLVALSLAASVCTYMLFSAFLAGRIGSLTSRVEPLNLPADIVASAGAPFADGSLTALDRAAYVKTVEPAVRSDRLTPVGRRAMLIVGPGSRIFSAIEVVAGRLPQASGEVLVPESLATPAGLQPGSIFPMQVVVPGPNAPVALPGVVVGIYRDTGDLLTVPLAVDPAVTGAANTALIWLQADRDPATVIGRVRSTLGATEVLYRGTPATVAHGLVVGVYQAVFLMVFLVFVFAGLGLLTVLLLSFVQRKRQFGILKAAGFTNPELQYMLFAEGLMMAAVGIIIGVPVGIALIARLNLIVETTLILRPGAIVWGVVFALIVFYLGSYIPATICRQAPVNALLFNRRVYLNANPSCAQCGRCGGF